MLYAFSGIKLHHRRTPEERLPNDFCVCHKTGYAASVEQGGRWVNHILMGFSVQIMCAFLGRIVELPLSEPFPVLAEAVINIKHAIDVVALDGATPHLTEEQWWVLFIVILLMSIRFHLEALKNGIPDMCGQIRIVQGSQTL